MTDAIVDVHLRPGRDRSVRQGHPWLFSGSIERETGDLDAPLAAIHAANGERLATGLYNRRSEIRVRILAQGAATIDQAFFETRLRAALDLRAAVVPALTTGVRLINAEGDGLPGWSVDRFGEVVVSQITATGLEALAEPAYQALRTVLGDDIVIVQDDDVRARRREG
ncbi:MAG: hypothetical protein AAGD38_24765, partial [Acidobacteriota bacterium]